MDKKHGNIFKKLSAIMAEVDRIPKNGYNDFHRYKYTTESDVSEHIRPLFAAQGLSICFSVFTVDRIQVREPAANKDYPGDITRVCVEVIVGDESGEELKSVVFGEGQDKGDKGLYKAYTGAIKYWLFKTFLISTGDDPEQHTPDNKERPQQSQQSQQRQAYQAPPQPRPEAGKPKPQPSVPEDIQPQENAELNPMTEPQRKLLWSLCSKAGLSRDDSKGFIVWANCVTSKAASSLIEKFDSKMEEFRNETTTEPGSI